MRTPGTEAKGEAGSAGRRSGVPAAASASARATIRRASSILKALSPDGLRVGERRLGRAAEGGRSGACAGQHRLGRAGAPGFRARRRRARSAPRRSRRPRSAARRRPTRPRRRRRCAREPSGSGHAPRRRRPRAGRRTATISLARFQHALALRRVAGQAVEMLRAGPRGVPLCPRSRRRRRARPAARRNPTDGSRCSSRSSRASRAAGLSPPRASQPAPGSRLLQALATS